MYLLIATLFVAYYIPIEWIDNKIKQIFNYVVFVLSKTLVENRQYILQDHGRIIEISG